MMHQGGLIMSNRSISGTLIYACAKARIRYRMKPVYEAPLHSGQNEYWHYQGVGKVSDVV